MTSGTPSTLARMQRGLLPLKLEMAELNGNETATQSVYNHQQLSSRSATSMVRCL
jgi:hypothetical protein